jgi:hypothetical protein
LHLIVEPATLCLSEIHGMSENCGVLHPCSTWSEVVETYAISSLRSLRHSFLVSLVLLCLVVSCPPSGGRKCSSPSAREGNGSTSHIPLISPISYLASFMARGWSDIRPQVSGRKSNANAPCGLIS